MANDNFDSFLGGLGESVGRRNTRQVEFKLLSYPLNLSSISTESNSIPYVLISIHDDVRGQRLDASELARPTVTIPEGADRNRASTQAVSQASKTANVKGEVDVKPQSPAAPSIGSSYFNDFIQSANNGIAAAVDIGNDAIESVEETIGEIKSGVDEALNNIGTGINSAFEQTAGAITNALPKDFTSSIGAVGTAINNVTTVLNVPGIAGPISNVTKFIPSASDLSNKFSSFSGITDKITKAFANVNAQKKTIIEDVNVEVGRNESKPEKKANVQKASSELKSAIALPMPQGLRMNDSVVYQDENFMIQGALADGSVSDLASRELVQRGVIGAASGVAGGVLARARGGSGKTMGAFKSGVRVAEEVERFNKILPNPRKEVTFTGVQFRRFDFTYTFAPKSQKEAEEVFRIIRMLRYYSSPQENGFFLYAPAEFRIKFMVGSEENRKIPRIKPCFIESVSVDYAPNGKFQSFADGFPPIINLNIQFKESEIIYRDKIFNKEANETEGGY